MYFKFHSTSNLISHNLCFKISFIIYYLFQSDVEKLEGLPVAPFMDRDKVTKPSAQIGFIKFVLIPLFNALRELFPAVGVSLLYS